MVFQSGPESALYILDRMMLVFNAVPSERSKVTAFSVGFWPCHLCSEISPDSLNLLIILWTVDDEIPKFVAIVR